MSDIVVRKLLITFTHGKGNGPSTNDVATVLSGYSNIEVKELDNDISTSVELGRRRINLRKDNKLVIGDKVKVAKIYSPEMIIYHIDTNNVASCGWFDKQFMHTDCPIEILEKINSEKIEKRKLPDSVIYEFSMNNLAKNNTILRSYLPDKKIYAIKEIREITSLGLKEAKDLVDGVTPEMILNWNKGIFE